MPLHTRPDEYYTIKQGKLHLEKEGSSGGIPAILRRRLNEHKQDGVDYQTIEINLETSAVFCDGDWPSRIQVEYGESLTSHELAASLASKEIGTTPISSLGFILAMGTSSGAPMTPIHHSTPVIEISNELALLHALGNIQQVFLKCIMLPKKPVDIVGVDDRALTYLLTQAVNEILAGNRCTTLTHETQFAIGSSFLLHHFFSAGNKKLERGAANAWLKGLETSLGFSLFFPPGAMNQADNSSRASRILENWDKYSTVTDIASCKKWVTKLLISMDEHVLKPTVELVDGNLYAGRDGIEIVRGKEVLKLKPGVVAKCELTSDTKVTFISDTGKKLSVESKSDEGGGDIFGLFEFLKALSQFRNDNITFPKPVDLYYNVVSSRMTPTRTDGVLSPTSDGRQSTDFTKHPPILELDKSKSGNVANEAKWIISLSRLQEMEPLGQGQFGDVVKGLLNKDGQDVFCAIKSFKKAPDDDEKITKARSDEFLAEAALMRHLEHSGIVKLYGIAYREEFPLIIMELMPLGDLRVYIRTKQVTLKSTALSIHYVLQVAAAIGYLHEQSILHRDLAARNILVKDPVTVKVADFGLSRKCLGTHYVGTDEDGEIPLKWMAPEAILEQKYTFKSDVWMFGVCCWEILSYGIKPFNAIPANKYLKAMMKGLRLERPRGCPMAVYQTLLTCWEKVPENRPRFSSIIRPIKEVLDKFAEQGMLTISDSVWAKLGGNASEFQGPFDVRDGSGSGTRAKNPFTQTNNQGKETNEKISSAIADNLGLIGLNDKKDVEKGKKKASSKANSNKELNFSTEIDFSFGVRSRACVWRTPVGDVEWKLEAAAKLSIADDEERLAERIRVVTDHVLEIKDLHAQDEETKSPGDTLPLVLQLGQDYHGVLDDVRALLEKLEHVRDASWHQRVKDATCELCTLFTLVLESMADMVANFGLGDNLIAAKKEVVRSCSKFAIGCMTLSNIACGGGNFSFSRFARNKARPKKLAQVRVAMRELIP
eukprot:m.95591 g.95591  ORF g.95591 m.95591 type:complete len:997 (+) comp13502_c0_seq3:459-3449(+)